MSDSDIVVHHRTISEISMCDEYAGKPRTDIQADLIASVEHLLATYSEKDKNHLIWTTLDRYALLVIRENHSMEQDAFECATNDLSLCETGFDVLSEPHRNALSIVHTHLYDVVVSASRSVYDTCMTALTDEKTDLIFIEELLRKFSRPSLLDEKKFCDRVLKHTWDRVSVNKEEFVRKHMNRIPVIIAAIQTAS